MPSDYFYYDWSPDLVRVKGQISAQLPQCMLFVLYTTLWQVQDVSAGGLQSMDLDGTLPAESAAARISNPPVSRPKPYPALPISGAMSAPDPRGLRRFPPLPVAAPARSEGHKHVMQPLPWQRKEPAAQDNAGPQEGDKEVIFLPPVATSASQLHS